MREVNISSKFSRLYCQLKILFSLKIWDARTTLFAIAFQWSVAISFLVPMPFLDFKWKLSNESNGDTVASPVFVSDDVKVRVIFYCSGRADNGGLARVP